MTQSHDDFRPAERGITLPETLAALVILAMVTVAVLTMFTYSMELNTTGLDYATLTNRARDKAEELLASAWYDSSGVIVLDPDLDPAGNPHTESQSDNHLNLVWTVTDWLINQATPNYPGGPPTLGDSNLKQIVVTAVSTSASGIGRRDVNVEVVKIKGDG